MADWRNELFGGPPMEPQPTEPITDPPDDDPIDWAALYFGDAAPAPRQIVESEPEPYDMGEISEAEAEPVNEPAPYEMGELAEDEAEPVYAPLPNDATPVTAEDVGLRLDPDLAVSHPEKLLVVPVGEHLSLDPEFRRLAPDTEELAAGHDPEDYYAGLDDEALVREKVNQDAQREQIERDNLAALAAERKLQVEQELEDRKYSMAAVEARMLDLNDKIQAHSQQGIDTDRWRNKRGTARNVLSHIGAIIGGFVAPNMGGRNPALDWIGQQIEQDIEAQRVDLDSGRQNLLMERNLVADMYQLTGNMQSAKSAASAAAYEAAAQTIIQQAAAYDPAGTTAMRAELAVRDLRSRKMAALAKAQEEQLKALMDERKQLRDIEQKRLDREQDERESRRQAWLSEQNRKSREREGAADRELKREERKFEHGNVEENELLSAMEQAGIPLNKRSEVAYVRGDDGKIRAVWDNNAADLQKKWDSSVTISRILGEFENMRRSTGHETQIWNSEEGQRMMVKSGYLTLLAARAFDLGAISESDRDLIEDVRGADPKKIRDIMGKIDEAAYQNEAAIRDKLSQAGQDVSGFRLTNYSRAESKNDDQRVRTIVDEIRAGSGHEKVGELLTQGAREHLVAEDQKKAAKFAIDTSDQLKAQADKWRKEATKVFKADPQKARALMNKATEAEKAAKLADEMVESGYGGMLHETHGE